MLKTAEEFVRLRTSQDPNLYRRAAQEPASEEVWLDIVRKYPEMRKWVAHNKTVPNSVLQLLAEDPDDDVRWMVAQKRKADTNILEKLARDPSESVRQRVAFNPKTPDSLLNELARDPCEMIAQVARDRLARKRQ